MRYLEYEVYMEWTVLTLVMSKIPSWDSYRIIKWRKKVLSYLDQYKDILWGDIIREANKLLKRERPPINTKLRVKKVKVWWKFRYLTVKNENTSTN